MTTRRLAELVERYSQYGKRQFNTKETVRVLLHNIPIFMSWGVGFSDNIMYRFYTLNDSKALWFRVRGRHFKGDIVVVLDWSDTYEVHFINIKGTVKKTMDNIYFDELVQRIDEYIEKAPHYTF